MLPAYFPTEEELEIATLKNVLDYQTINTFNEEGLIASLVHDIFYFDYFYQFSDDGKVWRKWQGREADIHERLESMDDQILAQQLLACFNKDTYKEVVNLVPWGKYINKRTEYTRYRWSGETHDRACVLAGLKQYILKITDKVSSLGLDTRVIYSDDILTAQRHLMNGVTIPSIAWTLHSAAIPNKLFTQVELLAKGYKNGEFTYDCLKKLFPYEVDVINDKVSRILKIKNFYIMFIKPQRIMY